MEVLLMDIGSFSFPVSVDTDDEQEVVIGFIDEVDSAIYF